MRRHGYGCYKRPVTPQTAWLRSSRCASNACVEIRPDGDGYLMRDSKHPDQPALRFTRPEWVDFLDNLERGDLSVM